MAKERGAEFVFNGTGLRSFESHARSLKSPLFINSRLTIKSRTVFDFMPIFHFQEHEVYDLIEDAGQKPHPIYGNRGDKNSRLSCCLCMMASKQDLVNGAINYPDKYHTYVAIEKVLDHSMFTRKKKGETIKVPLTEKTGVPVDEIIIAKKVEEIKERQKAVLEREAQRANQKKQKKVSSTKTNRSNDDKNLDLFDAA